MGQVRITNAGYLYFDFFCKGARCREYTELKNTPENMKIMNEAMHKIDGEIQLGTFVYDKYFPGSKNAGKFSGDGKADGEITFGGYARKWYKNNKIQWKPSVRRDFSSIMEGHLITRFGDKEISGITKPAIKEFRTDLSELKGRKGKGMSNKRINNILGVMRLVMNEAAEECGFGSPMVNLKPLPVLKPEIMPLSLKEVFIFLDSVAKAFYNYYVVRFFTGMRTAEIDGLKWKCVDFVNKKIMVSETWQSKQWVAPKTERSVRDIDMSKRVQEALLDQKKITGGKELVFSNKRGQPFDYNNISKRIWYPTLIKAGLVPRTPYQTRHTCATLWLASGENPEWIAKQLGHSDTQMLFKTYSKFIPNLTRRDGTAFEKLIDEKYDEYQENEDNQKTENDEE